MGDKWLNDIKNKMADYESDEPDGLWSAIECKRRNIAVRQSAASNVRVLFRRSAVAAVFLALVGFAAVRLLSDGDAAPGDEPGLTLGDYTAGLSSGVEPRNDQLTTVLPEPISPADAIEPAAVDEQIGEQVEPVGQLVGNRHREAEIEPREEETANHSDTIASLNYHKQPRDSRGGTVSDHIASVRKSSRSISFSMYTSGAGGLSSNRVSPANLSETALGIDCSSWADSPLLGMLLFNKGRATEVQVKHHQPLTFGLTIGYSFNRSLSFETGINYTFLGSDVREGGDRHYYSGKQSLHYLGIPLRLRYNFASWKLFDFYVSAGFQAQKCVSGKLSKSYIIDNAVESRESSGMCVKPVQWSAGASAGVQFRLTRFMGLYAEPGVGYWFDNGSDIRTVYKDRPFEFNVNIGLRFSL